MASGKLELQISTTDDEQFAEDDFVAYLSLPAHPGRGIAGVVVKQLRLSDILGEHGPVDVYLDFDANGQLIGLELVR